MRTFLRIIALACAVAAPGGPPVAAKAVPGATPRRAPTGREHAVSLTLTSSAFRPQGEIPSGHTCDGEDVSPPLAWTGAPAGTKSFALVVDDPDAPDPAAPRVVWVHWVLYDLPASTTSLARGTTAKTLPPGTREGLNDWKQPGWRGPCPPIGRHRYFHKLYALDIVLPDLRHPNRAVLEKAMAGHVLAQAELVGTYQRTR
jgi:Raf kinase inhibitor-like YbhB/YbcL family protein